MVAGLVSPLIQVGLAAVVGYFPACVALLLDGRLIRVVFWVVLCLVPGTFLWCVRYALVFSVGHWGLFACKFY